MFYCCTGRRAIFHTIEEADNSYHLTRGELDAIVSARLAELLQHAIGTVPYYRDISDHDPDLITAENAMNCLRKLPKLTKDVIRNQGQRLHSSVPGEKVRWNTSGGSTGEPVQLLQDRRMRHCVTINKYMYMRWLGYRYGEPHLLIWGVPEETFARGLGLRERFYNTVHNQIYLNCYRITEARIDEWIDCIRTKRPAVIEAYADAITEVSRRVNGRHIVVPRPRGIITSAGVLTVEARSEIERAFGCPVLNRYGSREVGDVACSCLHSTALHISELMYFVEIVDNEGSACPSGVEGDVLVTLLTNTSMPLIRYEIQDRAIAAEQLCPCGRTSKCLSTLTGRQSDYLVAADGSMINGTALTTLLYRVGGIGRFQYRQRTGECVELAVVPTDGVSGAQLRDSMAGPARKLEEVMKGVRVDVVIVDRIEPTPSGKYRYIINEIVAN